MRNNTHIISKNMKFTGYVIGTIFAAHTVLSVEMNIYMQFTARFAGFLDQR